jgi:hypothetical protein
MKEIKINLTQEFKLITNLIVDSHFCQEVLPLVRSQYFETPYAKEISKWIQEYFDLYKSAPFKNIKDIYTAKKNQLPDETSHGVYDYLKGISADWDKNKPNNVDFAISEAIHYLKKRSMEVLTEDIKEALENDDTVKGEQRLANFKRVEKPLGQGVSILHDDAKIVEAFLEEEEVLFTFPGALGKVAGNMCRGDFVAFLAPMKRGKTWWLWYTAETALYYSHKVLFFTLEMTDKQVIRRSWRSLVGQPKKTMDVTIPYFSFNPEEEKYEIEQKVETREGLNLQKVKELQMKFRRKFRKGDIRIISLPSKSATVEDLNAHIDNMYHYENFVPDVVVIDYADLLSPKVAREYRHGLDEIWSGLRRLSMERNTLVVTASQTDRSTFKQDVDANHVAEDIRKIAHITCGLSLNQTAPERELGIMRVGQSVVREEQPVFQQAIVLQCLDIGHPCIDSKFNNEVIVQISGNEEQQKIQKYRRKKSE